MLYPFRRLYSFIKNMYLNIFIRDIYKFILLWIMLAFLPIIANVIFEVMAQIVIRRDIHLLEAALLIILPIFATVFAAFLFISLWVAFESRVALYVKLSLIMLTYILILLSFGNLFYFFSSVYSFTNIQELLVASSNTSKLLDTINQLPSGTLSPLQPFWHVSFVNNKLEIIAINRLDNYIDCLYFSSVNILTIGFGDIVPVSRFIKLLVILESFLGMIINVLAVGMWLSSSNNKDVK